jgi:hypothetical protein
MLSVVRNSSPNGECHNSECHYAECHYAECHYAECHYAECHYAKCRNAQCPGAGEAVTRISGYSYKRLLVYYTGGRLLV